MRDGTKPRLVLLIIGLLLFLVSYGLADRIHKTGPDFWIVSVQTLAFIVLTIVVVDFAWSLVGGDPIALGIRELRSLLNDMRTSVKLLDDSRITGVRRVLAPSSTKSATEWMQHLASAQNSVDLMGYTLHVWTKSAGFESTLERLVKSGVEIRLLIMAADNPHLEALINRGIRESSGKRMVTGEWM